MLYTLFIISLVIWIILCWQICSEKYNNKDRCGILFVYNIFFILTNIFLTSIISKHTIKKPTALDVYRDKTELQITKTMINDSIVEKCDTIVVFKKN